MKSFVLSSLMALLISTGVTFGASPVGKVVSVKGEAFVAKLLKPKKKATVGMEIHEKDKIKTGTEGEIVIDMFGETNITLSKGAYLKIPKKSKGKDGKTKLNLLGGSLKAEVKNLGAEQSFSIRTPSAVAGVRGTIVGVSYGVDSGITGSQSIPHSDPGQEPSEVWTAPAGPGVEDQLNQAIMNDKSGSEGQSDHGFTTVTEGQGSFHMPNGEVFVVDMEPGQDLASTGSQVAKDAKEASAGAKSNARFRNMDEDMIAYLEDLEARLNNINPAEANATLPGVPAVPGD
jgi:hypothetical protein